MAHDFPLDILRYTRYLQVKQKFHPVTISHLHRPAVHHDIIQLFLDAVRVDAVSLSERPMADFVKRTLADFPIEIREDDSARHFSGDCGNLICLPRGFDPTRPALALLAHLDTPRSTANVHPIVSDTTITSDGTTALGVDNRAGVSVLLQTLRAGGWNPRANFIVVFTVAEEVGPFGSQHVDLSPFNVRMCYVFDCSKRPGTYISAAVGCWLYTALFEGKASHAGVAPEKGVNAIHAAATALSRIRVGRLSPTMTANMGTIRGGSATNVVPAHCQVIGEVREFAREPIIAYLQEIERIFKTTAAEFGAAVRMETREDFAPFRLGKDDPAVQLMDEVLMAVGLEPHGIEYLGGSDANMLNGKGIPSVNLGIGAQNPHGDDEFILLEDLHKTVEIASALIERSARLV